MTSIEEQWAQLRRARQEAERAQAPPHPLANIGPNGMYAPATGPLAQRRPRIAPPFAPPPSPFAPPSPDDPSRDLLAPEFSEPAARAYAARGDLMRRVGQSGSPLSALAQPVAESFTDPVNREVGADAFSSFLDGLGGIDVAPAARATGRFFGETAPRAAGEAFNAFRGDPLESLNQAGLATGRGLLAANNAALAAVPGAVEALPDMARAFTYGPLEDYNANRRVQDEEAMRRRFMPRNTVMRFTDAERDAAGSANLNAGFNALNATLGPDIAAGASALRGVGRPAARAAAEAAPPLRAADRGGSADLAEAARMARQAPPSLPMDEASRMGRADEGRRAPRRVTDIVTPRGETHETVRNPSEADILRLTRPGRVALGSAVERGVPIASSRGVRYIKDLEGNIYVGNSYDVTHHDLVTHYDLPNRGLLDGGEIIRLPDGTLELQNNDGAMPLQRGWLTGTRNPARSGESDLLAASPDFADDVTHSPRRLSELQTPRTPFAGLPPLRASGNDGGGAGGLPMDEASRMARAREMGAEWTDGENVAQPLGSLEGQSLTPGALKQRGDAETITGEGPFASQNVYGRADEIAAALSAAFPNVHIGQAYAYGGVRGRAGRSGSAMGQSAYISTPWGEVRVSDHAAGDRPGQALSIDPSEIASPSHVVDYMREVSERARRRGVRAISNNTAAARRDQKIAMRIGRGETPEVIARNTGASLDEIMAARERHLLRNGADAFAVLPNGNIRSRFAAFDPSRSGESDLLAGLAPFSVPGAIGGAALGGALAPQDAQAGDGSGGSPLDGLAAVGGGAALGAVFGPRIGRGAGRGRITNRSSAAEGIADETGTSADFARVPTDYAAQSYGRLLDAAEQLARESGGRLPPNYSDALAGLTGYEASGLRPMISKLRSGAYGPELQARARTITGTNGRPNVNRAAIERLMDEGLSTEQVHERLNALRVEQGLEPSTLATVGVQMSQIRRARRGDGAGALAGLAAPATLGAGALALSAGDADAQESPEVRTLRERVAELEANAERFTRVDRNNPDAVRAEQEFLQAQGLYGEGFRPDGVWGDGTTAAVRQYLERNTAELEATRERLTAAEQQEASRSTRATPEHEALRTFGPAVAPLVGLAIGHGTRMGAVRNEGRRLAARNAQADALLTDAPLTQLNGRSSAAARAEANAAAAGRAAQLNEFWTLGGAGERVPFRPAQTERGFQARPRAAEGSELFPPGNQYVRPMDIGVVGGAAADVGASTFMLEAARRDLTEAEEAAAQNPNEANLARLESLRDAVAAWEALQRAGYGVAAGRASGVFQPYPNTRPNVPGAEAERAQLNQFLAPRRPPRRSRP